MKSYCVKQKRSLYVYQVVYDMKRLKMGGLCLNVLVQNVVLLKLNLSNNRETG